MPSNITALDAQAPVTVYARLLRAMHQLIARGHGDSTEAEELADRMDGPWHAMTAKEQLRMRGLGEDLYVLREGGPKQVHMDPKQLAQWQNAVKDIAPRGAIGDVDAALAILRQPVPHGLPPQVVPFLQSRCWEKLGDLETALVFMKEADRMDPSNAFSVLMLLQSLGRLDETAQYAMRVVEDPASPPLERYVAAVALVMPPLFIGGAVRPGVQKAVEALRRALDDFLSHPAAVREQTPDADAMMSHALGVTLEGLGDREGAVAVYTQAIERQPQNGTLYVWRGLARYEVDLRNAIADFQSAISLGVGLIWPYLLLARHALQSGAPGQALELSFMAEKKSGPTVARAEVYELIGMARAELGHPRDDVIKCFDVAVALDPTNDRIRDNREIALRYPSYGSQHTWEAPTLNTEGMRATGGDPVESSWRSVPSIISKGLLIPAG